MSTPGPKIGTFGALLLCVAGCVQAGGPDRAEVAEASDSAVPIRLAGPGEAALLVPVRVNGTGPYDFVLDTGATLTCVDAALADSLGLPDAPGATGVGATLGGRAGAMRLVEIDSLAVGGTRAEGLTGCAVDLSEIRSLGLEARGLLGLNFLTSFRVTLDFADETLLLERR